MRGELVIALAIVTTGWAGCLTDGDPGTGEDVLDATSTDADGAPACAPTRATSSATRTSWPG